MTGGWDLGSMQALQRNYKENVRRDPEKRRSSLIDVASKFTRSASRNLTFAPRAPSRLKKLGISDSWTVDPNTLWVFRWNQLIAAACIYSAIAVPLQVAFAAAATSTAWIAIDGIFDAIYWLDLLLHFRLGFRTAVAGPNPELRLELHGGRIGRRYAKSWLAFDLIAVLPLHLIVVAATRSSPVAARYEQLVNLVYLPRLLRFCRLFRAHRFLTSWQLTASMLDPNGAHAEARTHD